MLANAGHTDWITVTVLLSRSASDIVNDYGHISITQYRILIRLIMNGGSINVTAIADDLGVSVSTVTTSLNALEQHKAIARHYDSEDKRIVHVEITDEGRELIAQIDPAIKELAHDFWEVYTDEELALTYKDSRSTAINYNLAYAQGDQMSIENAYVDSSWVIMAEVGRQLRRANISLNEYRLLYLLSESSDGIRPSDAARRLLLRSNEVTVAVSKLEKHERLRRERSSTDRRSNRLFLTQEGMDKLERITPSIVDALRYNICDLDENAFDLYDSIARKLLKKNQVRHLIV